MTAFAALVVLVPMLARRRAVASVGRRDIVVYADQLAEVDRDFQRGLIDAAEQVATRTEIGRRILRADAAGRTQPTSGGKPVVAAVLVCLAIPALSFGLYALLGSPTLPDEPLVTRKTVPVDQLSPEALIAKLDERLAANPNDLKGWDVAGPIYLRVGRYGDAANAFRTAIRLGGADAPRQAGLGEALTADAQGVVTAEARGAFEAASTLDPKFPLPKMYLALALSQDGRLQDSVDAWKAVIALGRGYEPWVGAARKELADVEAKLAAETGLPGAPADAPADAAAPASPAAADDPGAQAMIQSMVARLKDRLDAQGGTPEDWGRLIRSYLVLGRNDDAKAAFAKAKTAFNDNPTATAQLLLIVGDLGLAQ